MAKWAIKYSKISPLAYLRLFPLLLPFRSLILDTRHAFYDIYAYIINFRTGDLECKLKSKFLSEMGRLFHIKLLNTNNILSCRINKKLSIELLYIMSLVLCIPEG